MFTLLFFGAIILFCYCFIFGGRYLLYHGANWLIDMSILPSDTNYTLEMAMHHAEDALGCLLIGLLAVYILGVYIIPLFERD